MGNKSSKLAIFIFSLLGTIAGNCLYNFLKNRAKEEEYDDEPEEPEQEEPETEPEPKTEVWEFHTEDTVPEEEVPNIPYEESEDCSGKVTKSMMAELPEEAAAKGRKKPRVDWNVADEVIIHNRKAGMTDEQIAELLHTHRSTVSRRRKKLISEGRLSA